MLIRNKKIKTILLAAFIVSMSFAVFFVFGSHITQAQDDPFGEEKLEGINLERADLIMTIINVINWVLGLLALIAIVLVLWAGYIWMTAGGNATRVEKAKKILINAGIGLAIIILSWAIVTYVFNVLEDRIAGGGGCTIGEIRSNGCQECLGPEPGYWGPWHYEWPGCSGGPLPENIFRINSIVTSCDNPPDYDEGVHLCSVVVINFNHNVDTSDIASSVGDNSLRIEDCSDVSCSSSTPLPQIYSGSTPTGLGNEWVASGRSASFVHEDIFIATHYYRLIIPKTISDTTGLEIDPYDGCGTGLDPVPGCVDAGTEYRWTFQTGTTLDDMPPEIISTYPIDQSNPDYPDTNVSIRPLVWARFSEPIAPWTVTTANIVITGVNTADPVGYSVGVNPQGNGFVIDDLILEPFMEYEVNVAGIIDLCNNPMAAPHVWRFQTNDTAPGIRSVYPRDGYLNACPDTAVFIVFNTSMYNPSNDSCAVLTTGGGYVTDGSFDPAVLGRNLRVVDDYPGGLADPNQYCQQYEFIPMTANLDVDTDYTVTVNTNIVVNQQGDILNHSWQFHVTTADECANAPVITRVSPDYGPDGECITISGRYFDPDDNGQGPGDSATFNDDPLTIDATAWSDRQIAASLPSPSGLLAGNYPIQVTVSHPAPIGDLSSNEYDFRLTDGLPAQGPCLYSLSPASGCYGRAVTARGIRFDSGLGDDPGIIFTPSLAGIVNSWTNTRIETQVPDPPVSDGDVVVTNSLGMSNPLYFDISCGEGALCFDDLMLCPLGDSNCQIDYECLSNGIECVCTPSPEGDPCSDEVLSCVPNDDLCIDPIVYYCDDTCLCQRRTVLPGPRVTNWWPRNCFDACRNTSTGANFNMAMDTSTLINANIDIFMCNDEDCAWDNLGGQIDVSISYLENTDDDFYQIDIDSVGNLAGDVYYRVILKDQILSSTGQNLSQLNFSITGGDNDSFSWIFATKDEICELTGADVLPAEYTLNRIDATRSYRAYALGNALDNCDGVPLNSSNYDWAWSSSDMGVATVLNSAGDVCAENSECNSGECIGGICTGNNPRNTATAVGIGESYIQAATSGFSDDALLTVTLIGPPCDSDLVTSGCQDDASLCPPEYPVCNPNSCYCETAPPVPLDVSILETGPAGAQACTNMVMFATFNQMMNGATLNNDNVKLEWFRDDGLDCEGNIPEVSSNNLIQKIITFFKKIISRVQAQTTFWCPVAGRIRSISVEPSEFSCDNEDGCTRMLFYPNNALVPGISYRMTIVSGEDGVQGRGGGFLLADEVWNFSTTPDAIVCQINKIDIIPSSYTFTRPGLDYSRDFQAAAISRNGTEISGIPGIYNWTLEWSEGDINDIILVSELDPFVAEMRTVTANNVNGSATLMATASVTDDIINIPDTVGNNYTGYAQITNFLCLNPWPSLEDYPYLDDDSYAKFSLFYCRDRGDDLKMCDENSSNAGDACVIGSDDCLGGGACKDPDDLPALAEPSTTLDPEPNILKDYLFLRADESTDAIGMRIFENTQHLSPSAWYEAQPFITQGSPSSLQIDGYQAIRDGRSVYVAATSLTDSNTLYTNIYLISYNENASAETTEIYNRLLNNWTFNTNVTDNRICSTEPAYCTRDDECPVGETCDADKSKLSRDTKRVTDLGAIKKYLNDYNDQYGNYPRLEAGAYEIGHSTSKWPSWNQTLGSELGKSMPVDPINEFNNCPQGYDIESCWNEVLIPPFMCPDGSHIYQYRTADGTSFNLYANMEYQGPGTWSSGSNSCQDYGVSDAGITLGPDVIPPGVVFFSITPGSVNIAWQVTDAGGSYLDHIEIHRAVYDNVLCNNASQQTCVWSELTALRVDLVGQSLNFHQGSAIDYPPNDRWWYKLEVFDQANNQPLQPSTGYIEVSPDVCTDSDNDGYGVCPDCNITNGCTYDGDDCDDDLTACGVNCNPGFTIETVCTDGYDNDCDGYIDSADFDCAITPVCADSDNDGYGVCPDCNITNGCTYDGDDCDDTQDYIYPGATETCDNNDNNCDTQIDEGCDDDNDDYCDFGMTFYNFPVLVCPNSNLANGVPGDDCDDNPFDCGLECNPGNSPETACTDGYDNDCDGDVDGADSDCVTGDLDPEVEIFEVTVDQSNVNVYWEVSGQGENDLDLVRVYKTTDLGGAPDPTLWSIVQEIQMPVSPRIDFHIGTWADITSSPGTYWYGLHVLDVAGNEATEPMPIQVTINVMPIANALKVVTIKSMNSDFIDLINKIGLALLDYSDIDLIITPEYSVWDNNYDENTPRIRVNCSSIPCTLDNARDGQVLIDYIQQIQALAQTNNVNIILGTLPIQEDLISTNPLHESGLFNTALIINRQGDIVGKKIKTMGSDWCTPASPGNLSQCQIYADIAAQTENLALDSSREFTLTNRNSESFTFIVSICADLYDQGMIDRVAGGGSSLLISTTVTGEDLRVEEITQDIQDGVDPPTDWSAMEPIYTDYVTDSQAISDTGYFITADNNSGGIINFQRQPLTYLDINANYVYGEIGGSIISQGNLKNANSYSAKQAFLISDENWQDVVGLVPVSVWNPVYPVLIYHNEATGFDADSIIYFIQQYAPDKVVTIGSLPTELTGLINAEGLIPEIITPDDYLSHWTNYDDVVYVQDNYELALLASTYASLKNAPLIVQDTSLDAAGNLSNKNIICVGNVAPVGNSCAETYNLDQLQQQYVNETNTDKIVLVNPDDLNIGITENFLLERSAGSINDLYSKTSLAAPFLASAKKEIILSTQATDYQVVDSFIENKISNLGINAEYLTIMASPVAIQMELNMTSVFSIDPTVYGDLDGDLALELAVGRIAGITVSDVSSYINRVLFYSDIGTYENDALFVGYESSDYDYRAQMFDTIFNEAGYNTVLFDVPSGEANSELSNKSLVVFMDHGNITTLYGLAHSAPWLGPLNALPELDNTFIVGRACETCAFGKYQGVPQTFCFQTIRKGAIGYIGSVDETYGTIDVWEFLSNVYSQDQTVGRAFVKAKTMVLDIEPISRGVQERNDAVLIGDPTFKIAVSNQLPESTIGPANQQGNTFEYEVDMKIWYFQKGQGATTRYYFLSTLGEKPMLSQLLNIRANVDSFTVRLGPFDPNDNMQIDSINFEDHNGRSLSLTGDIIYSDIDNGQKYIWIKFGGGGFQPTYNLSQQERAFSFPGTITLIKTN